MKYLALSTLVLLGCGKPPLPQATLVEQYEVRGVGVVSVFELRDGTRCAAYRGAALQCNWK